MKKKKSEKLDDKIIARNVIFALEEYMSLVKKMEGLGIPAPQAHTILRSIYGLDYVPAVKRLVEFGLTVSQAVAMLSALSEDDF